MRIAVLPAVLLLLAVARPAPAEPVPAGPVAKAQALLTVTPEAQRQRMTAAFTDEARLDWNFVPMQRVGLPIGEMNEAQRAALQSLLDGVLSKQGRQLVDEILKLEHVLQAGLNSLTRRRYNSGGGVFSRG